MVRFLDQISEFDTLTYLETIKWCLNLYNGAFKNVILNVEYELNSLKNGF